MNRRSMLSLAAITLAMAASSNGNPYYVARPSKRKKPELNPQEKQKLMSQYQTYKFNINGVEIEAHSKKDAKKKYQRLYGK